MISQIVHTLAYYCTCFYQLTFSMGPHPAMPILVATPKYNQCATAFAQKPVSGVHMPYSADWPREIVRPSSLPPFLLSHRRSTTALLSILNGLTLGGVEGSEDLH